MASKVSANPPAERSRTGRVLHYLNCHYRRLATGFCFLTFMTGGLFLAGLVLPLLHLLPISGRSKHAASIGMVQSAFRVFTRLMWLVRVIDSLQVSGLDNLSKDEPFLFIANHPTLIDVVTILGKVPRCNCIVKASLFRNPFMGGVLRRAGFLPNLAGPQLIELTKREFEAGYNLLIFPEGTRSPVDGLHSFNRGAAQIALRTGVRVLPIHLTCVPLALWKGQSWYDVPERAVDFSLNFLPPMDFPVEIDAIPDMPLKVRALNRHFEAFFKKRLEQGR